MGHGVILYAFGSFILVQIWSFLGYILVTIKLDCDLNGASFIVTFVVTICVIFCWTFERSVIEIIFVYISGQGLICPVQMSFQVNIRRSRCVYYLQSLGLGLKSYIF